MPRKAAEATEEARPASELIDARIADLADWRGDTLARVRTLIHQALPDVQETWKWRGTPVWEHNGILCTGETYKQAVKLTFAHGAALPDPKGLFNASLEGNTRRAIDIHEGAMPDATAFKALVRAAAKHNAAKQSGSAGPCPASAAVVRHPPGMARRYRRGYRVTASGSATGEGGQAGTSEGVASTSAGAGGVIIRALRQPPQR